MQQMINNIIVYTNRECSAAETLVDVVLEATDLPIRVAYSHERIQRFLRQVIITETIIVFFAFDKNDLRFIRSLREKANEIKLILVLPDNNRSTFCEGFLSYPRFITCPDYGFADVSAVLKKIVNSNNQKEVLERR